MKKIVLILEISFFLLWNIFAIRVQADNSRRINVRMQIGQEKQLDSDVKIISYDRDMLELKKGNVIVPHKTGTTKLIAKKKNKKIKYIISVRKKKVYNLNLYIEDTYKIKLDKKLRTDKKIHFISSNRYIASVTRNGKIRARKPGRAIIKLYRKKKVLKKYVVNVSKGYTLSFPKDNIEMIVGQKVKNPALKSEKFNETIFYESSAPSIVSVDSDGNLIAKKVGQVVITAEGIQAKAICIVNVVDCIYNDVARFIAHRGFPADQYTENTMNAFINALNRGFYGIETDIRVTCDGVFVLAHSESIWDCGYLCTDEVTDKIEREGRIEKLTYAQLQKLTSNKIVTVADFLEFMRDKQEKIFLEIKSLTAISYPSNTIVSSEVGMNLLDKQRRYQVRQLLNLIYEKKMEDKVVISSFDADYLEKIREIDSNISIQYTASKADIDINYLIQHHFGIDMPLEWASDEQMQLLRQNNIVVCLYCADTREETLAAIEFGATNITTNKCLFIKR